MPLRALRRSHLVVLSSAMSWACLVIAPGTLEHRVVRHGSGTSLAEAAGFAVVVAQEGLDEIVGRIDAGRVGGASRPVVDFGREVVVFVSLGVKPSAGHSVSVAAVERAADTARLELEIETPAPGRMHAAVIQVPYVMVALPRAGLSTIELYDTGGRLLGRAAIGDPGLKSLSL